MLIRYFFGILIFFFCLLPLAAENSTLLFIEGEDAVTTSFNKEPIYNFNCSGGLTLQLSTTVDLKRGNRYYAQFVISVPEQGNYELWYGGTPPGPEDPLKPGYFSPFSLQVDEEEEMLIHRENINVVEEYSAGYYWNKTVTLSLTAGIHTIKFFVNKQRNFDNRFYFYLDCLFLIKSMDAGMWTGFEKPEIFVNNPFNRDIDYDYLFIEDYEDLISKNETDIKPIIDLAEIYTHTQNFIRAIKYYKRALLLEPDNADFHLMVAKNYIWMGDFDTGLSLLINYLDKHPEDINVWQETAKLCAWSGKYDQAAIIYKNAIKQFPENAELKINLGMNYLWAAREFDANNVFDDVKNATEGDTGLKLDIANIYYINNYLDRAVREYEEIISSAPDSIAAYIYLNEIYIQLSKPELAENTITRMEQNVTDVNAIENVRNEINEKNRIRDLIIEDMKKTLILDPYNLEIRYLLAQTYFWNKMKIEAIDQYEKIMETELFYKIKEVEEENLDLDNQYTFKTLFEYSLNMYITELENILNDLNDTIEEFDRLKQTEQSLLSQRETKTGLLNRKQEELESNNEIFAQIPAPPADPAVPDPEQKNRASLKQIINTLTEEIKVLKQDMIDIDEELLNLKTLREENINTCNELNAEKDIVLGKINNITTLNASQDTLLKGIYTEKEERREIFLRSLEPTEWSWNEDDFFSRIDSNIQNSNSILSRQIKARALLWTDKHDKANEILDSIAEESTDSRTENNLLEAKIWNPENNIFYAYMTENQSSISGYNEQINEIKEFYSEHYYIDYPPEFNTQWAEEQQFRNDISTVMEHIKTAVLQAEEELASIAEEKKRILTVLYNEYEKGVFEYELESVPRYNEIGDFYYKNNDLNEAIYYYTKVLSIEPGDINAIYYLGTIFEQNNEWIKASENYLLAYELDPGFFQAAAKYNQVMQNHPRTLSSDLTFYIEKNYHTFEEELSLNTHLNHILGINAHLIYTHRTEVLSINKTEEQFPVTFNNSRLRIGVDYIEAQVNLPINIKNKLIITPSLRGGLAGFFNGYDIVLDDNYDIADNYFNLKFSGGGAINFKLPFRYIVPELTMDIYPVEETMRPFFDTVYRLKNEAKVVTNFSFLNFYPFREMSLLNSIEFNYYFDKNKEIVNYNELNLNIVNLTEIGFRTALRVEVSYETKLPGDAESPEYYWLPNGTLNYGGRIDIAEDFTKIDRPFRLLVYGFAGQVFTDLNTEKVTYFRWKLGSSFEWEINNLTVGLAVDYISTDNFDFNDLSYSSLSVGLNILFKFPDTLKL